MKIVVLNDLHPSRQGGAAFIALQNARLLATENQVEFWCTGMNLEELPNENNLVIRLIKYGKLKRRLQENFKLIKLYFEFFDLRISIRCFIRVLRLRPDLVWVHQIGNGFPKSITLTFWFLGIPMIQTLHDYSLLVPGKLFPSHFGWSNSEVDLMISKMENGDLETPKIRTSNRLSSFIVMLRFKYLRQITNLNSVNIVVGPQQERIFRLFGLDEIKLLPNITSSCVCHNVTKRRNSSTLNVLFAGRPAGKGLGKISKLVQNTPNAHLYLAGDSDLLNYLPYDFPHSKFTFLGKLEHSELLTALHDYDYISVLSECFDVYPSVLIEALEHSSRVLCTSTVGNHLSIASEFFGYQIPYDLEVNQNSLASVISEKKFLPYTLSPVEPKMSEEQYRQELLRIANNVVNSTQQ